MNESRQSDNLVFDIYHVGDGDSTFIEFPDGKYCAIIDSYKPRWRALPPAVSALKRKVKSSGRCDLSFVCVSHPHVDHVCGLLDILDVKNVTIKELWHSLTDIEEFLVLDPTSNTGKSDSVWNRATQFCYDYHIKEFVTFFREVKNNIGMENVKQVREGTHLAEINGVQVFGLNPCKKYLGLYKDAIRNCKGRFDILDRKLLDSISVTLLFTYGDNAMLYASDIQKDQWLYIISTMKDIERFRLHPPVSVIKASHHGGPLSFCNNIWDDVLHENGYVIVSGGSMTHPHERFISSVLNDAKKRLLCTGKASSCGRGQPIPNPTSFHAVRWMEQFGPQLTGHNEPCYGDIRITLPPKGPPLIKPQHVYDRCKTLFCASAI